MTNLLAKLNPLSWANIKPTFTIMWKGLVAIFAVIFIIILVVQLVNVCVNKADKAKKARAEKKSAEKDENSSQG